MAKIYEFEGIVPVVDPTAFVHPEAVLIGDVIVGPGCYVAPFASLRGDFGRIILNKGVNVQDSCTMHTFPGKSAIVDENGHIGHGSILHGCHIKRGALVGMNAVIMDGVVIGENSLVGACAFVKAGFEIPPRSLVAGHPARVLREMTDEEIDWKNYGTSLYQELAQRSLKTMKETVPDTVVEADRKWVDWSQATIKPLHELKKREE